MKRRFATPDAGSVDEPIRFADVLTTASAVANYLGMADVTAAHMLDAIAVLRGEKSLEDLGRPLAPLVPRSSEGGAEPAVRELAQRWWNALGGDISATLDVLALAALRAELEALLPGAGAA